MSWQSYVDQIADGAAVKCAAIFGLDGSPWAITNGWAMDGAEAKKVAEGLKSDPDKLAGTSVNVAGVKFLCILTDRSIGTVYVKKGVEGCVFVSCKSCVVVGYHADSSNQGMCISHVKSIADLLLEQGM